MKQWPQSDFRSVSAITELSNNAVIFFLFITLFLSFLLTYYVNGEKITNKVKKIGKYTYCFDKTGKLVTNKPYSVGVFLETFTLPAYCRETDQLNAFFRFPLHF